ncbi:MAG: hybrid sensor histidine kinase/response regulator [Pseudanabaena sp.]|jgi:signal transduction histidine kinase
MTNQNLNQIEEETKANNASILIVDDTIYNIQLLSLMLNKHGYQVEKATSGTEALENAKRLLPDIILLDIRMPDIDGYEVCKRLKADPETKNIPIIFISSIEETTDKVEAFSVGGVDYISKPFQLIEVLARIETHLRLCLLQKKLQEQNEELQSSAIVLSRSLEQECKLSQMKSDFISVVSHEFRTPLTTIQSASELLEYYEWTKEEQVEQLHQIQSEVKHMTDLMEDVLFLSRANASRAKLHLTKFDLIDFCKRILVQMKKAFAENYTLYSFLHGLPSDIAIENFHLQNELPLVIVNMDEKLLRQIITNLITNAIKYSDQNSVIEFRVTVNSNVSPNVSSPKVSFVISDRGIGIPEEDLEHLFSAFHRGKNVGILPGSGLGLSIVKNCIDIHNGSIAVNSKLNVGTEFTVTLPLGSKN